MTDTLSSDLDHQPSHEEPEIDFGALIASLATSALLHLGESYGDEAAVINLPMAKQSIEIIGMLQEKTRGNLTVDEQHLIDEVLFDLRKKFLQISQVQPSKP